MRYEGRHTLLQFVICYHTKCAIIAGHQQEEIMQSRLSSFEEWQAAYPLTLETLDEMRSGWRARLVEAVTYDDGGYDVEIRLIRRLALARLRAS